jgi:hypothetical protein
MHKRLNCLAAKVSAASCLKITTSLDDLTIIIIKISGLDLEFSLQKKTQRKKNTTGTDM